jgi:hypothetical protein
MRSLTLLCISLFLICTDRVTTWIAINSGKAREINPYVNTGSFVDLVLSPVPISMCALFLLLLLLTERYSNQIHALLIKKSALAPMCLLPLFFIWTMTFICINNVLGVLGFITPLTRASTFFSFVTEDPYLQFGITVQILNIAGLPVLTRIAEKIYTPENLSPPANNSSIQIPQHDT